MKKTANKIEQKKLDILWSAKIKERDRKCVRCGKTDHLQSAHIFSRSQKSVRWVLENGLCLCGGCHLFWAHKNPIEFSEFVREHLGEEQYERLRIMARTLVKVDMTFLEMMRSKLEERLPEI